MFLCKIYILVQLKCDFSTLSSLLVLVGLQIQISINVFSKVSVEGRQVAMLFLHCYLLKVFLTPSEWLLFLFSNWFFHFINIVCINHRYIFYCFRCGVDRASVCLYSAWSVISTLHRTVHCSMAVWPLCSVPSRARQKKAWKDSCS